MISDLDLILYGFITFDVILYIIFFEGLRRYRKVYNIPKIKSPEEVFAFFERSYKELFPQEQDGFTWGEAIAKASNLVHLRNYEWESVQKSLRQYEARRYGGDEVRKIDIYPILKLTTSLRERL